MTMYFDYTISDMLREIERNKQLKTHYNINSTFTEQQFYEFFGRYDAQTFNNLTNSICSRINKANRKAVRTYLVDATPVAVDINLIKKYYPEEELERLKLKLGFSKTKNLYKL